MRWILVNAGRAVAKIPDEAAYCPGRLIKKLNSQRGNTVDLAGREGRNRSRGRCDADLANHIGCPRGTRHREDNVVKARGIKSMRWIEIRDIEPVAKIPFDARNHAAGQVGKMYRERGETCRRILSEGRNWGCYCCR